MGALTFLNSSFTVDLLEAGSKKIHILQLVDIFLKTLLFPSLLFNAIYLLKLGHLFYKIFHI